VDRERLTNIKAMPKRVKAPMPPITAPTMAPVADLCGFLTLKLADVEGL
jgi:hypothetical protein